MITVWVLCVIPLLAGTLGYLVLHLPEVNRALWQSASHAAHLAGGALAARRYAAGYRGRHRRGPRAAFDRRHALHRLGTRAARVRLRAALVGGPAAAPPARVLVGVACAAPLSVVWLVQGQFSDW